MARKNADGKRVNITDNEFISEWKSAVRGGGSIKGLANKLEISYGAVVARRTTLNEGFVAAGQPELPEMPRAKGKRTKDYAALAQVGEVAEVTETAEGTEGVDAPAETQELVTA